MGVRDESSLRRARACGSRLRLRCGASSEWVTDEIYASLAEHWDEEGIVEILGVICMFGVFNRWNDSLATTLEEEAIGVAQPLLEDSGWEVGKHG